MDAINNKASIRITVHNKKTRNALYVSVWNNGPKISEEIVPFVFDEGISSKGQGRGMGLYIIKQIAERFNADISLDQTDGVLFSIVLPLI